MWEERQHLEDVCIFLKEEIHNITINEELTQLEMDVRHGEEYPICGTYFLSFCYIRWCAFYSRCLLQDCLSKSVM